MDLPSSERPSKLGYFVEIPLLAVLAVTMALYVVLSFLFFHWDGIYTLTDAVVEFVTTTIGCYLGICLLNLVWDRLFY